MLGIGGLLGRVVFSTSGLVFVLLGEGKLGALVSTSLLLVSCLCLCLVTIFDHVASISDADEAPVDGGRFPNSRCLRRVEAIAPSVICQRLPFARGSAQLHGLL